MATCPPCEMPMCALTSTVAARIYYTTNAKIFQEVVSMFVLFYIV